MLVTSRRWRALVLVAIGLSCGADVRAEEPAWGQMVTVSPASHTFAPPPGTPAVFTAGGEIRPATSDPASVFGGIDFLLIRPTFSQAVAFARGTQGLTSYNTVGESIEFDYEASGRGYVGYGFAGSDLAIAFTYSNVSAGTGNEGTVSNAGEFIVDPFGNIVGAVQVINPADNRFGTVLAGGDAIETYTTVDLNVYDIDFMAPIHVNCSNYSLTWAAGVRLADLNQTYQSTVYTAGVESSGGAYEVDFFGVGPHVGFSGYRHIGASRFLSLFAKTNASLLVGQYDVTFQNSPVPVFTAQQDESTTRTIPVLEAELGMMIPIRERWQVSAGWLFQSWWDLGASGGTFDGFYSGADDGNIMAFDGLFLRAEFVW